MTVDQSRSHPVNGRLGQQPQPRTRLQLQLLGSVGAAAMLNLASAAIPAPAQAQTPAATSTTLETVTVRAQKRILKEKNSPSASTEIGTAQITQTGVAGSVATLLRAAPSVFVYQQGIGDNEPVLTIRGVRGLETAQTLDGVPMQDLLNGGTGGYLQNIIGGRFNLDQISGVTLYPGVAYPDKNTFGTIGGTVAYDSQRPSKEAQILVTGSAGSFGTYNEGIELDSGQFDSGLGTGDDGASFMAKYSNLQSKGFVDFTPSRYNSFEAAFDKPFDDGLSKIQGTILFNTGNALYTPEPVPLPFLNQNGLYSNYPTSTEYSQQYNKYLTIILKADKYVNDYLDFGGTAFYLNSNDSSLSYANPNVFQPTGVANPYAVGLALPFLQTSDGFGDEGDFGPNGFFYSPFYPYDGNASYPAGSKACPSALANAWANAGYSYNPCGYNASLIVQSNHTYGIQERTTITPPDIFGIANTIKVGGLVAKEVGPTGFDYFGGTADVPQTAYNNTGTFGASNAEVQRTIYQLYLQDKVDFIDNTLHFTPGATVEGTSSSYNGSEVFDVNALANSPYPYGAFKSTKWDRDYLPFLNISYDFDKIMPAAKGLTIYGSLAQSALYAPTTDFSPNLVGSPPNATIVHMYEGGLQYDTPLVAGKLDYFYQKIDRDFGFFQYQSGALKGQELYNNAGQREIKGVEASIEYQATPEIQLFGNASHQLAKYLKTGVSTVTVQEDQFGAVQKGDPITGVPDWLSTFGVDYTKKDILQPGDKLAVRFEGQYTGHQYTTYDVTGFSNLGMLDGLTYGSVTNDGNPPGYDYYEVSSGATVYDPNGGINPFTIFNLDLNYTMPTPSLKYLRQVTFDINGTNIFAQHYWQYFYKQISPGQSLCPNVGPDGNFTSGPYKGYPASNYCGPSFADGIPGEPIAVTFTITAKF